IGQVNSNSLYTEGTEVTEEDRVAASWRSRSRSCAFASFVVAFVVDFASLSYGTATAPLQSSLGIRSVSSTSGVEIGYRICCSHERMPMWPAGSESRFKTPINHQPWKNCVGQRP